MRRVSTPDGARTTLVVTHNSGIAAMAYRIVGVVACSELRHG